MKIPEEKRDRKIKYTVVLTGVDSIRGERLKTVGQIGPAGHFREGRGENFTWKIREEKILTYLNCVSKIVLAACSGWFMRSCFLL